MWSGGATECRGLSGFDPLAAERASGSDHRVTDPNAQRDG
jgi:hypothetical protein